MADLSLPVGAFLQPYPFLEATASLSRAAELLAHSPAPSLLVVQNGFLIGEFAGHALFSLADGVAADESIAQQVVPCPSIDAGSSGAEALRELKVQERGFLPVVDGLGRYLGVVTVAGLLSGQTAQPDLGLVGGMATPLGVYLTDGVHKGGPGILGLVLTGALMFALLSVSNLASLPLGEWMDAHKVPVRFSEGLIGFLVVFLFFILMRLTPLAGIHAAEHQVVHALERNEPLTPAAVRRMPRVHPRCGTNIGAAAILFGSVFGLEWVDSMEVRLMAALILTLFFWRPFGEFVQHFFTTKPANEAQIRGAITSAEALIEANRRSPHVRPNAFQRLWSSGLLAVMAGSFLTAGLVYLLSLRFPALGIILG